MPRRRSRPTRIRLFPLRLHPNLNQRHLRCQIRRWATWVIRALLRLGRVRLLPLRRRKFPGRTLVPKRLPAGQAGAGWVRLESRPPPLRRLKSNAPAGDGPGSARMRAEVMVGW